MIEILQQKVPEDHCRKKQQEDDFQRVVDSGHFLDIQSQLSARTGRREALEKWKRIRTIHPHLTDKEIKALQRCDAVARERKARVAYRAQGVTSKGKLAKDHKWRLIEMGDKMETWKKKLSFVPAIQVRSFGTENLAKLQSLQDRLVEEVRPLRLRGGTATRVASNTTKTKKHQEGKSFGMTVVPSGGRPRNPAERTDHYSGTVQFKKYTTPTLQVLQMEVIETLTACIEEAFGHMKWYKATKEAFKNIPENRRLPHSSMPASAIWWNWNVAKSVSHIDANVMMPCFVLTPYTYHGAELLSAVTNSKIPMEGGKIVAGSWARFAHCNDELVSGERYSFVVYFDYRLLDKNYWLRY